MKLNDEIEIEIDFSNLGVIYVGNAKEFIVILLLLKLDHFHNYLSFLKEHFSNGFSGKEEAIENLRKCFQKIQNNLSQKLNQLEK